MRDAALPYLDGGSGVRSGNLFGLFGIYPGPDGVGVGRGSGVGFAGGDGGAGGIGLGFGVGFGYVLGPGGRRGVSRPGLPGGRRCGPGLDGGGVGRGTGAGCADCPAEPAPLVMVFGQPLITLCLRSKAQIP